MKTFIAGVVIALAVTAIGWYGLEATQISKVEATRGETNVRLNREQPRHDALPGRERSAERP